MFPKIIQKSSQTVVKKAIKYNSDLVCEYTLTDSFVTSVQFVSKKEGIMHLLLDEVSFKTLLNTKENLAYPYTFDKKSSLKREEDLIGFKNFQYLFQIYEGTLKGIDGQYHVYPVSLSNSYLYSSFSITTKEEMQDFSSYIRKHPDIEVIEELAFDYVPYYNQNEEGTRITLTSGLIKVKGELKTASLSKSSLKDGSFYFSYSSLLENLYKGFSNPKGY